MKIIIDEVRCTNIELLQFEVNSRKEIITGFLQTSLEKTELFKQYEKEYQEYFKEYNKAKLEMLKTYGISPKATWSLDFTTRELTY
jgi:hypothetical protein